MQGVVARRNNFTEPILEFFEAGLRRFRRADRPPLRPGHAVQDRRCRHGVRVAGIGGGEHRSGRRLPARAAQREGRFDSSQRLPAVPRSGRRRRRSPARRTSSSSSAPTSRWPATIPMGRDIRTALHKALQGDDGPAGDHGRPDAAPLRRRLRPRLARLPARAHARRVRVRHRHARAQGRQDARRTASSFMVLGVDHPYEVKSDETPSLLPEGSIAVRFHSVGGWGAITTGKNLGAIIGDLNDLALRARPGRRRVRQSRRKSSTSAPTRSTARRRRARRRPTSWSRRPSASA